MIIDGKRISNARLDEIKTRVETLRTIHGRAPKAVFLTIGENTESLRYVSLKAKRAKDCGIEIEERHLAETVSQQEVCSIIECLASDSSNDGILIQLPLPEHLEERQILDAIPINRDIDGLSSGNIARLYIGESGIGETGLKPCTPLGVLELAKVARQELCGTRELNGLHACIVGRSQLVGKPCQALFERENCTTTLCHSHTTNLSSHTKLADILVSATGVPNLISGEMLKKGSIAIDVGISYIGGKMLGDFQFESCRRFAGAITPVPGGVGPMTICMLMQNIVFAAEYRAQAD